VEGVNFMDPYSEVRCDPHHLVIRCAVDGNRKPIAHRAMQWLVAQRAHWHTAQRIGFERARVGDNKLLQTYWPTPTTGVYSPSL